MIRKALIVMSAAGALVAALGAPASATPTGCATAAGLNGSVVQVCVDHNGSQRRGYVQAQAATQPVQMDVHRLRLEQCNNGGDPLACTNVLTSSGFVSGFVTVSFMNATAYAVQFGHTYRACATVTVNGYFYGEVCSVLVRN